MGKQSAANEANEHITKNKSWHNTFHTNQPSVQIYTDIEIVPGKKSRLFFHANIICSLVSSHIVELDVRIKSLGLKCEDLLRLIEAARSAEPELPLRTLSSVANIHSLSEESSETDKSSPNVNVSSYDVPRHVRNRRATKNKQRQRQRKMITLATHFKGSQPEVVVQQNGIIGPWFPDSSVFGSYKFSKFHLREDKCAVEVTESALYFIYAQVYYVTSDAVNGYTVYVRSEGSPNNNVVAKCSVMGPNSSYVSELSCYTASVYNLKAHDRVFISQTDKNKTVILRDGYTFLGIVRLSGAKNKNRVS